MTCFFQKSCSTPGDTTTLNLRLCTQVGVVSEGPSSCEHKYKPGVYVRLYGLTSAWIDSQVCLLSKDPPPSCQQRFLKQKEQLRRRLLRDETAIDSVQCTDTDQTFGVGGMVSGKDCSWLASLKDTTWQGQDLCHHHPHIAYRCQKTCNSCRFFALLDKLCTEDA